MPTPSITPFAARTLAILVGGALLLAAPAAVAQQAGGDGFKGRGAALCIASGELLAAEPGADAGIRDGVLAWRQVLHVMEGTEEQRQAAVESAREGLTSTSDTRPGLARIAAQAAWDAGCRTREMQVRYIAVHASEERVENNLADEAGAALDGEAARRLNRSAACLVTAELFLQPRPSRTLRAAFSQATPRAPDPGVLQAVQAQSRRDVDAVPGSAVGKELVVDYLRYIFNGAAGSHDPQGIVNGASRHLHDRCGAGTP